ncbi:MAG: glycosyltransferase family 4 protein [Desulfurococcales archaeon]|nr:glycosyltransferase family 4 protein [Desulfurococcales archaeon]MCE4604923.1 glycosyltransferase family 4 protein [Desulfurococcales archaeon]
METLRILWLNWRCIRHPRAGGAEVYTHEIARRLASLGHEIVLATSRPQDLPSREEIDGYTIIRKGGSLTVYPMAAITYTRLKRSGFKPDIVVDEVNTIPFMTPLYSREPITVLIHQLCRDCWGLAVHPLLSGPGWTLERILHKVYVRAAMKGRVRLVVTVSDSTRRDLEELGYPRGIIEVVHNGIDPSRYPEDTCKAPKEKLIAYVGRISKYKRLEDLLRAWRIVESRDPEARLIIAGRPDHGYLTHLRYLAARLGLSRASINGEISEREKLDILSRATALAYTSQREGWGRTIIEAGACYTPSIAYRVPGLSEAVVDGVTGVLVDPGDIEGLARSILKLLADQDLSYRMGRAARSRALSFSWDESAKRFLHAILDATY